VDAPAVEGSSPAGPDLARLIRWTTAGGGWRVSARTATSLTVALVTCDGGEEMDRIVSSDPELIAHVDADPGAGAGPG
jgi:hypothetical protein